MRKTGWPALGFCAAVPVCYLVLGVDTCRAWQGSTQAMREWGKANGHKVSDRGRVSAELQAAYHAAN